MKKLIMGVAAIAASAAMASGIVSSSVVGYQTKDTVTGFNFVIPTFAAVGEGGVNIQDIKISNSTDWTDNIQILDEGGATVAMYVYVSAAQSGFDADGWAAEDFSGLADVDLEPGLGVIVDTAAPATVTIPGVDL